MDIFNQFGVQPVLLAAQAVNFLILLFILKKFLYGPILKVLNERRKKIEDSLKNAEEIERRLKDMTDQETQSILKSAREGEKIIREASDYAVSIIEDGKKEYEKMVSKAVEDAKKLARVEKEITIREVKENLAGLLILTYEKITGKVTRDEQKRIIEREVKNLS